MDAREKLEMIEDSLEKGLAAITQMAEALRSVTDGLDGMTEHYVRLAGSGDCGFWEPEAEPEVIAARKLVADIRDALVGLPSPPLTDPLKE